MDRLQAWFRRLAQAAFGLSVGASAELAQGLEQVPSRAFRNVIADAEEWSDRERIPLLRLAALDPRPPVRAGVGDSLAGDPPPWSPDVEEILALLAHDTDPTVRAAAVEGLAGCLAAMRPLDRTPIIARWALDPLEGKRLTLALALSDPRIETIGVETAFDVLSDDRSEAVRDAARHHRRRSTAS
jgi:hypothetical protein